MPRVHLTRQFAEAAVCPPNRQKIDFFDASHRGFMLEVRASGGKTFYQRYTDSRGRERQYKIGPADVLSLDQARRKARLVLAQALVGEDPQQQRRELRATLVRAASGRRRTALAKTRSTRLISGIRNRAAHSGNAQTFTVAVFQTPYCAQLNSSCAKRSVKSRALP